MVARPAVGYATRADGVHIGYLTLGDGPVTIGWPGSTVTAAGTFDEPRTARFQREIATFSTRVTLDRRGIGYSDPLPGSGSPTLEEQALDVLAVLDHLEAEQATLLVGGWEAQAMLHLAAVHPERVARLVLLSTTPKPMAGDDWPHGVSADLVAEVAGQFDDPGRSETPRVNEILAPSSTGDEDLWTWLNSAGRVPPATAAAYVLAGLSADVRHLLPRLQAPALILHNTRDGWAPIGAARFMAEQIPEARLVEYDSADHLYFTTHLSEKIAEIEAFVGEPDRAHAQRRLLTVLFTDVVGSTERVAATEDRRWTALLDEIDSTVTRQVRRHDGRVCKSMGDGHLALFERPSDAVGAALAIQRALRATGVEIRAGAHIGEVELRGDDVAGVAVHVGARVSGKAGGGELLVTRTVADLLGGSTYRCEPAGEHVLKGLPGHWQLVRVHAT